LCCTDPEIEATILEFMPLAHDLYHKGLGLEYYQKLKELDSTECFLHNRVQSDGGFCSRYEHRGLICRLFGFSARTSKHALLELVTCNTIKTTQVLAYQHSVDEISAGRNVLTMNQYYMRLQSIDYEKSKEFFPINIAILHAIESVLHYYAYR